MGRPSKLDYSGTVGGRVTNCGIPFQFGDRETELCTFSKIITTNY
jgi:hypothetical protein